MVRVQYWPRRHAQLSMNLTYSQRQSATPSPFLKGGLVAAILQLLRDHLEDASTRISMRPFAAGVATTGWPRARQAESARWRGLLHEILTASKAPHGTKAAIAIQTPASNLLSHDVRLPSTARLSHGAAWLLGNLGLTFFQVGVANSQFSTQLLFALR